MIAEIFLITAIVATVLYVISGFFMAAYCVFDEKMWILEVNAYLLVTVVYCFFIHWIIGDVS